MGTGTLTIDLDAVAANWRALNDLSGAETGAVVKADAYGLGLEKVAKRLAHEGARTFFVAVTEEGVAARRALGPKPDIFVFSGHMAGDTDILKGFRLFPLLNSIDQLTRHFEALDDFPFGIQLDTGMNRLGMEPAEWAAVRDIALQKKPKLVISHLACADEPGHPQNAAQLAAFREMTEGIGAARSFGATGGILLGPEFHFEMTRPGIGLFGGLPFAEAMPAVRLSLPVIQVRDLVPGETVGYGATFVADGPRRIATVSGGYADGLIRAMGGKARLYHNDIPCPLAGRVSMDLLTVDITHLPVDPNALEILNVTQTIDTLSDAAGTIGYEILTSLGSRYRRRYTGLGA